MKQQKLFKVCAVVIVCMGMMLSMVGCDPYQYQEQEQNTTSPTDPSGGSIAPQPTVAPNPGGTTTIDLNLVINDPLTNGKTLGTAEGGTFTAEGFRVNSDNGEYLAYSTSLTDNIRVEFDAKGYTIPGDGEKRIVIEIFDTSHDTMWGAGPVWDTNALCQVKKVDAQMRIKVGAKSVWGPVPPYVGYFGWDANTTYHWVVKLTNGTLDVTRNGEQIMTSFASAFQASAPLNIRIGGSWWDKGSGNVTYSNVKIYKQ